jgi:hypothetical protein
VRLGRKDWRIITDATLRTVCVKDREGKLERRSSRTVENSETPDVVGFIRFMVRVVVL